MDFTDNELKAIFQALCEAKDARIALLDPTRTDPKATAFSRLANDVLTHLMNRGLLTTEINWERVAPVEP